MWSARKFCNKNVTLVLLFGESYNNYCETLVPITVHCFSWINQTLQGQLKIVVFLFSNGQINQVF